MPRKADLVGIEVKLDANGRERYRPYVPHPQDRNRKVRGSWTHSFPEAKAWRARTLGKVAEGISILPAEEETLPTVREASETFIAGAKAGTILSRRRKRYESKTVRGYEQSFRDWINPTLGDRPIDTLKRSEVQRWVDGVNVVREGSTVRNVFHALAALYRWLLPRYDQIGHDPTIGIELPAPSDPRERYADPEEAAALLAALPDELALPWALAFWAGLRRAEIQSLPLDMIDLEDGWIQVQYSLDPKTGFKGPKSGAGVRVIPIFEPLRPYLEEQVARERERLGVIRRSTPDGPGSLLLPSRRASKWGTQNLGNGGKRKGAKTTRTYGFLDKCRERWQAAGLTEIGLHEARHSFATTLIRAGYDVKAVQEWIGHAQASTTLNIYVKNRGRGNAAELVGKMNSYLAQ